MVNCKICAKPVSREEKFKLSCVLCSALCHIKCTKIDRTDQEAALEASKKWTCPECESASRATGAGASTVIDLLRALTEEVKEMKAKLQAIDELKDIKDSLNKQSDLSFENMEKLKKIENLLEEQNTKVEQLTLENGNLKAKIIDLEGKLNHVEQNQLRNTIEIRGIPEKPGETVVGTMLGVGAGLGVKLTPEDLDHVVRLRPRQEGTPGPIIARFVRQGLRDELVRQRRAKRDFSTRHLGWSENESHRVYLNEAMTSFNKHLYWLARQKKTSAKIKYIWFSGGKVRCRQSDGYPAVVIEKPSDLDVFP